MGKNESTLKTKVSVSDFKKTIQVVIKICTGIKIQSGRYKFVIIKTRGKHACRQGGRDQICRQWGEILLSDLCARVRSLVRVCVCVWGGFAVG